jgi:hypothetical protein
MYAFPLYTRGGPKAIRGVDVVGHSFDTARFWVMELKASGRGRGDSPLRALCEALIYAAVIEANHEHIAAEMASDFNRDVAGVRSGLVIAAPSGYWQKWAPTRRTGDWWSMYRRVIDDLSAALVTPMSVVDLGQIDFGVADDGRPFVVGVVESQSVSY